MGICEASLDQLGDNLVNPKLTMTVDIRRMLQVLSEATPEQLEQAKETKKLYLAGHERTVTGDGNSSMDVLK